MKTTDLIPLVLYQLVDGDKYGYEIVKQIEDSSNGRISIKQPTLYSVLKKLEHGRIISSYWQDSEIGGKRHYYKLTDNGRAQLDTYPSFEQLISEACDDSLTADLPKSEINNINNELIESSPDVDININDDVLPNLNVDPSAISVEIEDDNLNKPFFDEGTIKPIKIDLTSPISDENVVMNDITINESTSSPTINIFDVIEPASNDVEVNSKSSEFPLNDNVAEDNKITVNSLSNIAVNNNLEDNETPNSAFTNNVTPISPTTSDSVLYNKLTPNKDLAEHPTLASEDATPTNLAIEQVKYLNYVDFSNDKSTIKRRKAITQHVLKMSFTCITLLLMFVLSLVVCSKYGFSKLYYVCAIIVCLIIILYPILTLRSLPKLRLKYCSKPFKYALTHDMLVKLSMFLCIVIIVFAYNVSVATSIANIFKLDNFSQFVAPIMFGATLILDFAYSALLYKNYK